MGERPHVQAPHATPCATKHQITQCIIVKSSMACVFHQYISIVASNGQELYSGPTEGSWSKGIVLVTLMVLWCTPPVGVTLGATVVGETILSRLALNRS